MIGSKRMTSWKSFVGSFSQTLFFGGVKRQPEIRLRSQVAQPCFQASPPYQFTREKPGNEVVGVGGSSGSRLQAVPFWSVERSETGARRNKREETKPPPPPPSARSLQFFRARLFRATSTIQKGTACSL